MQIRYFEAEKNWIQNFKKSAAFINLTGFLKMINHTVISITLLLCLCGLSIKINVIVIVHNYNLWASSFIFHAACHFKVNCFLLQNQKHCVKRNWFLPQALQRNVNVLFTCSKLRVQGEKTTDLSRICFILMLCHFRHYQRWNKN